VADTLCPIHCVRYTVADTRWPIHGGRSTVADTRWPTHCGRYTWSDTLGLKLSIEKENTEVVLFVSHFVFY